MGLELTHDSVYETFVGNGWILLSKVADRRTDGCYAFGFHRVLK